MMQVFAIWVPRPCGFLFLCINGFKGFGFRVCFVCVCEQFMVDEGLDFEVHGGVNV